MIKPFEFYFDFISPYSYLAHNEIRRIENKELIKIKYMPILLGGLHKLAGITANAFIPHKAKFMIKDCKMWAEKYKIKFKFNTYFPINSIYLMRGVLVAEKENYSNIYIDKIFDSFWKDGLNLSDPLILEKILENLKLNPKSFLKKISDTKIKDDLKKRTESAYDKGIFGAPSFVINNKMFWGQDRLEFVLNEASQN